jgi:hypothetical protein
MEAPPPPTPPPVSQPAQTQRTLGETINTWMQIVAILLAGAWGVYTFFEKEVFIPKSAPVNISVNLQLKKVATGSGNQASLTAVEMNVAATNPSTREVHLLPSAWIAHGAHIRPVEQDERDIVGAAANALTDSTSLYTLQRHAVPENSPIVATGLLFADAVLKPSQKVTRTIIFYVPKDAYDLLEVIGVMPSGENVSQIALEWTLNEDKDLEPAFYRLDKKGNRSRIQKSDAFADKQLKLEWTRASSEVSLWP